MRIWSSGTIDRGDARRSPGSVDGQRGYNPPVSRIYSLQDADAILPDITVVVQRLRDLRDEVVALRDAHRLREAAMSAEDSGLLDDDPELVRLRLRTRGLVDQMQADAAWLDERDIVLRDISTGLLDFPAEADGQPIWLCWRLGEPSVTAWHTPEQGFAGRRPIEDLA
jgi:hypothetical protein